MDKIQYKLLLPLVNDTSCYSILLEYTEVRMKLLMKQLSTEQDMEKVKRTQGAIAELQRFKTLRNEVIKGSE